MLYGMVRYGRFVVGGVSEAIKSEIMLCACVYVCALVLYYSLVLVWSLVYLPFIFDTLKSPILKLI